MSERESFEQILPIEFKPEEVRIWHGQTLKPYNLTDCDRVRIDLRTIEIDSGNKTYIIHLEENNLSIDCPYGRSVQHDQKVKHFNPKVHLSIETCPN